MKKHILLQSLFDHDWKNVKYVVNYLGKLIVTDVQEMKNIPDVSNTHNKILTLYNVDTENILNTMVYDFELGESSYLVSFEDPEFSYTYLYPDGGKESLERSILNSNGLIKIYDEYEIDWSKEKYLDDDDLNSYYYSGTSSRKFFELSTIRSGGAVQGSDKPIWITKDENYANAFKRKYVKNNLKVGRVLVYKFYNRPRIYDNENSKNISTAEINHTRLKNKIDPFLVEGLSSLRESIVDKFGYKHTNFVIKLFQDNGYDGVFEDNNTMIIFKPQKFLYLDNIINQDDCYISASNYINCMNKSDCTKENETSYKNCFQDKDYLDFLL